MGLPRRVKGAVNEATQTRAVEWLARAGYPVSGVLHLLIAYLIVRVALGFGGDADQVGALATLDRTGGGALPLWIVAAGLIALAMWRFAEAVLGLHPGESTHAHRRDSPISDRLRAFGLGLLYCAVAFTAIQFALNVSRWGKDTTEGLSARLMQSGGGKAVLVIVGFVVAAIGAYYVHKGATRKFLNDLTVPGGRLMTVLGICGHVGEGLVLFAAGLSVIAATYMSDPAKATGLDAAVRSLGHAQFGTATLIAAATGFAAYGLYSFALARYSRM
ncbi:DUF1206 domain-containing protein [Mycolicibacterium gadium]|jgi:uncharacterized membrane protein|uniref:DUF1206 domain-containing protein n=1 Tax=Mycolicibacterium gadium TaxID=1794 RepID=A0ABT6GIX9_MYCGU|nr:DUF1206 domain-containing protein [Mycolicibacterium gadium]MDG5481328.1 DUF1206 domain-containing protein [Mycolicibacterium gadium]